MTTTYSIRAPQRFRTDLGQTDVVEFIFLDEFHQCLDGFFDRNLGIDPRTFIEVNPFSSTEFLVDVVDTSPQVLGPESYYELI